MVMRNLSLFLSKGVREMAQYFTDAEYILEKMPGVAKQLNCN